MGTISYDVSKIKTLRVDFATVENSLKADMNAIIDNINIISNENNWAGPIASTAKTDLESAKTALSDIMSNMKTIRLVLDEAIINFGKVKY